MIKVDIDAVVHKRVVRPYLWGTAMSGEIKVVWPHPSPLQDWWAQVMSPAAKRVNRHLAAVRTDEAVPDQGAASCDS